MEFPEVVELNVGGRHMSTLLSTLTKYPDSMLAAMFSGRHHVTRDKDGRFFIDADGDIFSHLLNFLRFETMPPCDKANQVKHYSEYFGIDELKKRLNEINLHENYVTIWKSNIPGYSKYFSIVKERLMTDVQIGYVCLYIRYNGTHYPTQACLPEHMKGKPRYLLEVKLHGDCDGKKHGVNLLTLLAHDPKQCGLCTEAELTRTSSCFQAILLKVL